MTNYFLKMPRLGGKVNSISQPLGGLIGGGANSSSGSGMDGGNNRAVNRNILRKAFGNEASVIFSILRPPCFFKYCTVPSVVTHKLSKLKDLNLLVDTEDITERENHVNIIWTISGEFDTLRQNIYTYLNAKGIDISINNITDGNLNTFRMVYFDSNLSSC